MTKLPENTPETQEEKTPAEPKPESRLHAVGQAVLHFLVNNWPFKLISVLLAIVLWSGLITTGPHTDTGKEFHRRDHLCHGRGKHEAQWLHRGQRFK